MQQLQQLLQLSNDEILQIEQPIVTQKEAEYQQRQEAKRLRRQQEAEYRQKLQQYEQELIKIVEAGNSLKSRDVRQQLKQLQRKLELKDTDIATIEARVVARRKAVEPQPPIQQPNPGSTLERIPLRINRNQFLKWAGFGSAGLVTAVVTREIFQSSGLSPKPISQQNFKFDVVTVDERGKEINRRPSQAQFFTEDLDNGVTLEMVAIPGANLSWVRQQGKEMTQKDLNMKSPFNPSSWASFKSLRRNGKQWLIIYLESSSILNPIHPSLKGTITL